MKFSFDFPEPSVVFGDYRLGFNVFSDENAYSLDRARMTADVNGDTMTLKCDGFLWAGGQERAPDSLVATFRRYGDVIEWEAVAEMEHPINTISTLVRGVPRGSLAFGNGNLYDPHDNEVLTGYPFGAGDLHGPGAANGMTTPLAVVQVDPQHFVFIASLDDRVRPKKFYFQPGESGYKVEAIYEHDGWRNDRRVQLPKWRVGNTASMVDAVRPHLEHLERAYSRRHVHEASRRHGRGDQEGEGARGDRVIALATAS